MEMKLHTSTSLAAVSTAIKVVSRLCNELSRLFRTSSNNFRDLRYPRASDFLLASSAAVAFLVYLNMTLR